ncbi:HdeA/HdeB family chaperone [Vibrio echinoideorum]|uniref:HdeA/HdeB family chaperone n=1 Tax=Vibrio echinoideorum TaxID=2100116 RepID=A0ABU9FNQ7_9VIBR
MTNKLLNLSIVTLVTFSTFARAANDDILDTAPTTAEVQVESTITCADFLELDQEVIPVSVNYLMGWDSETQSIDTHKVEDFDTIDITQIVEVCEQHPTALAVEVIEQQTAKANAKKIEKAL